MGRRVVYLYYSRLQPNRHGTWIGPRRIGIGCTDRLRRSSLWCRRHNAVGAAPNLIPFQLWIGCTDRLRRSYRSAQHYWYWSPSSIVDMTG
eukprot:scaffold618202_cov110-Attheya_sp.AAC.2